MHTWTMEPKILRITALSAVSILNPTETNFQMSFKVHIMAFKLTLEPTTSIVDFFYSSIPKDLSEHFNTGLEIVGLSKDVFGTFSPACTQTSCSHRTYACMQMSCPKARKARVVKCTVIHQTITRTLGEHPRVQI
jgi:hypothetical protein